jgi:hypothetical protein
MSSLPVLIDPQPETNAAPDPSLFTRERQTVFLAALAATGQVRSASARAGVSHQTAYRERLASPGFRRAWDAALLAARAQAEEMLACRALEGWEEDVIYHGEVVATRRRFSDRLLLAHLARLDKLCGDVEVAEFADTFEDNLARFSAGEDRPARPPEQANNGGRGKGGFSSSGQWSTRSSRTPEPIANPCPDCGGRCVEAPDKLTHLDCHWLGYRLEAMEAERPITARAPQHFPGGDPYCNIQDEQLAAFEAGVEEWWRVVPAPEGEDPAEWHYLEED